MPRFRLALALLGLTLPGAPVGAQSDPVYCYSAVYHPDHGTCGWTGTFCNRGKGCLYDCSVTGETCITWVDN